MVRYKEQLSFSVVTFNNETTIEKLLMNLINILDQNISYRVIVIDNGSTDNTISIVRQIQQQNKHISLINRNSNLGFGSGHNVAIPLIGSKFHVVINPDISIDSFDEIERMFLFLSDNTDVGLLSPLIMNTDGTIQRLYKKAPSIFDLFIRFISPNFFKKRQDWFVNLNSGYDKLGHIDYASGSFMFFRTSVFKKIGGFDDRYFMYMEDADITRKVNEISSAIFFLRPELLMNGKEKVTKEFGLLL